MKRGQVSIFIIWGLIIVVGVGAFFVINNNETSNPVFVPIENFVQGCLESVVDEAIVALSLQGGYSETEGVDYLLGNVPFYFENGKKDIPSKQVVESEFSKYIEKGMKDCVGGFDSFEDYNVEEGKIDVLVRLSDEIDVKMDYRLSVSKGEDTISIKDFEVEMGFDFDRLMNLVSEFGEEHQKNPDFVPLGFLSLFAEREGFTFDLVYANDNEVVYSWLLDDVYEKPLMFNFAGRYRWDLGVEF